MKSKKSRGRAQGKKIFLKWFKQHKLGENQEWTLNQHTWMIYGEENPVPSCGEMSPCDFQHESDHHEGSMYVPAILVWKPW